MDAIQFVAQTIYPAFKNNHTLDYANISREDIEEVQRKLLNISREWPDVVNVYHPDFFLEFLDTIFTVTLKDGQQICVGTYYHRTCDIWKLDIAIPDHNNNEKPSGAEGVCVKVLTMLGYSDKEILDIVRAD